MRTRYFSLGMLLAGWARGAQAEEHARAHLTYLHAPEIERCPSERQLRDSVAARLGYDPFVPLDASAVHEVSVLVTRGAKGIVGKLELKGPEPGSRDVPSPSGDCREVVDALAVAMAIGLDPASIGGSAPTTPPPPDPPKETAPLPPPALETTKPAMAPLPASPLSFRLAAGMHLSLGELPSLSASVLLAAGARWKSFSLDAEGQATLAPSETTIDALSVRTSLLVGTLVPCAHVRMFVGCVTIGAGSLRGTVESGSTSSQAYVTFGARMGAEIPLYDVLFLHAWVSAQAPMTRVTITVDGREAWTSPILFAHLGVALAAHF